MNFVSGLDYPVLADGLETEQEREILVPEPQPVVLPEREKEPVPA